MCCEGIFRENTHNLQEVMGASIRLKKGNLRANFFNSGFFTSKTSKVVDS